MCFRAQLLAAAVCRPHLALSLAAGAASPTLRLRHLSDGKEGFPGRDEALAKQLSKAALGSRLVLVEARGLRGGGERE